MNRNRKQNGGFHGLGEEEMGSLIYTVSVWHDEKFLVLGFGDGC